MGGCSQWVKGAVGGGLWCQTQPGRNDNDELWDWWLFLEVLKVKRQLWQSRLLWAIQQYMLGFTGLYCITSVLTGLGKCTVCTLVIISSTYTTTNIQNITTPFLYSTVFICFLYLLSCIPLNKCLVFMLWGCVDTSGPFHVKKPLQRIWGFTFRLHFVGKKWLLL